jgi:DNA primase
MAKTYVETVKYQISVEFEISGIVDKHDIIGAIFGQSEGLMGEDLDLRELQKSGKIGRIEVKTKTHSGKTTGELFIPSSMDMVKTSLLAASIEAVDKVGPCDSVFKTRKIDDARVQKRQQVQERAKELLRQLTAGMPESTELTEAIRADVRTAELREFGKEKLPAGPDVEKEKELIIVEGRADVINLLKHGIKNVIAVDGAKIPKSIVDLSKRKTVTAFVDGDRGGELIARKLIDVASIDFVSRAPDGKEVEELTGKEIITSLRRKASAKDFEKKRAFGGETRGRSPYRRGRAKPAFQKRGAPSRSHWHREEEKRQPRVTPVPKQDLGEFGALLKEVENTLKARLYGKERRQVKEVNVRDLLQAMGKEKGIETVVFDGIVTKRLLEQAEKSGIKTIVGVKKGKIEGSKKVRVLTAA